MTYKMKKIETEHMVRVICSDYPRRKRVLEKAQDRTDIVMACSLLNKAVDDAIAEAYALTHAYAPNFGEIMRTDIAECRGFAHSPLSAVMCEGSYKKYKRMVKQGIATRLGL